jgi:hypothetical protein
MASADISFLGENRCGFHLECIDVDQTGSALAEMRCGNGTGRKVIRDVVVVVNPGPHKPRPNHFVGNLYV